MEPKIIFQDAEILVLDKPAGWIVNDAATVKGQPTVQDWLRRNFQFPRPPSLREGVAGEAISPFYLRSGIVHRLDKETSGLLIVAKTEAAFAKLQAEFKERKVHKTYIALVHGRLVQGEGEIKAPVGRLPWRRDRFGVLPGGREATTGYKVVRYYDFPAGEFSLLELEPQTGRTHQIRIHLRFLGHPIVADEFYAGRKTARDDRKWCPRLFLHAAKIAFIHPTSGLGVSFESALPEDLGAVLSQSSLPPTPKIY